MRRFFVVLFLLSITLLLLAEVTLYAPQCLLINS